MVLKGKTILTTRAASQSGELRSKLENLGARVIECPSIEIVPPGDWSAVDDAVRNLSKYQWLVFTSANAVEYFMRRVAAAKTVCAASVAAVGPATARRLRDWKIEADIVPAEFRAEGLLQAMPESLWGIWILFPRAEKARDVLPLELRRRGAKVDVVTVYRTVKPKLGAISPAEILASEKIDCIVFTSPSTIRYLAESIGESFLATLSRIPIAVIGPVTDSAAKTLGLETVIHPEQSTIDGLVSAISRYLS